MQFDRWKGIAELIGFVAIVASLVFVGLQLRQDDQTARLELFDRSADQMRELSALIAEHAEVWYRGCSGVEMSGEDDIVFAEVYNAYLNTMYIRWTRYTISDVTGSDDGSFLIDAFAANIHRYPGMRTIWEERGAWSAEGRRYQNSNNDEFAEALNKRLAELAILEPNPSWDVKFCGT